MDPSMLMILVGIGLVIAELIVGAGTGFDLLLIGLAMISGGGLGQLLGDFRFGIGLTLLLLVFYLIYGRNQLKSRLKMGHKSSNIDALLGKTALVTKSNQVKLAGETWRAESDHPLKVGDQVRVVSAEGVTLKVVKLS